MKIFISFPMKGKSYNRLLLERESIMTEISPLIPTDVEIINSIVEDPNDNSPLWYLGVALQALSQADLAVFTHDWENARGCRIEHQCAKEYGIPTLEIN